MNGLRSLALWSLFFAAQVKSSAQCNLNYNWAQWTTFTGSSATGKIVSGGQTRTVTISANYPFGSTSTIWGYNSFDNFKAQIPNTVTPSSWWPTPQGGLMTMCFDAPVQNPVLMVATLGDPTTAVKLTFSLPFQVLYLDSNVIGYTDTTLTGQEGYAILEFPGTFTCVSITSDTTEYWTNLTWALNPLLFHVVFTDGPEKCDSVTVTASGGNSYSWSGGEYPDSATNTFLTDGTYRVFETNSAGCSVTASTTIVINHPKTSVVNASICKGQIYMGHSESGIYTDTLASLSGCDSFRTLNLSVVTSPQPDLSKDHSLCQGDTLVISPGKFDNYLWQDGSTLDHLAVTNPGTYSVSVSNACGSSTSLVTIAELPCIISFPNAFTPNGDGKNDKFHVLNGQDIIQFHLIIYDRWGMKVFETLDVGEGWDGRVNGSKQNGSSTFVWYCEFEKRGETKTTKVKGTVVLIR